MVPLCLLLCYGRNEIDKKNVSEHLMLSVVVFEVWRGELAVDFNSYFGESRTSVCLLSDLFLSTKLQRGSIRENLKNSE